MTGHRVLLPTLLLVVSVLVGVGPAMAEPTDPTAGAEPTGDVKGFRHDPTPRPCGTTTAVRRGPARADIVALTSAFDAGYVRVTVRYADLGTRADRGETTTIALRTERTDYEVDIDHRPTRGVPQASFHKSVRPPKKLGRCGTYFVAYSDLPCDGLESSVQPALDEVTLGIPVSCLRSPSTVQVGARSRLFNGSGKASFYDTWAPAGTRQQRFIGPFGPPVLVPAA